VRDENQVEKVAEKLVKELANRVEPLRAFFPFDRRKKVASVPVHLTVRFGVIGTLVSHIMSFFASFFSSKKGQV